MKQLGLGHVHAWSARMAAALLLTPFLRDFHSCSCVEWPHGQVWLERMGRLCGVDGGLGDGMPRNGMWLAQPRAFPPLNFALTLYLLRKVRYCAEPF